jgi:branched-chain amino acid transport system permease protein
MEFWRSRSLWITLIVLLGVGLWPVATGSATLREDLFLIFMLIVLASSLNILLGYTGYVNFGHIVFFGLGGYIGFYLMHRHGWGLWPARSSSGCGGLTSPWPPSGSTRPSGPS